MVVYTLFEGRSIPFSGAWYGCRCESGNGSPFVFPKLMLEILDFAWRSCRQRCKKFVAAPGKCWRFYQVGPRRMADL